MDKIIVFAEKFKTDLLMPLARAGKLNAEVCDICVKRYCSALKAKENVQQYTIIEARGTFSLLHPYTISPFTIDKKLYNSVEHYYQSSRFFEIDEEFAEEIRTAPTPQLAHNKGIYSRGQHKRERNDWEANRKDILIKAYAGVISEHPEVAKLLKSTKGTLLKLYNSADTYIGINSKDVGENMIGIILSGLREKIP